MDDLRTIAALLRVDHLRDADVLLNADDLLRVDHQPSRRNRRELTVAGPSECNDPHHRLNALRGRCSNDRRLSAHRGRFSRKLNVLAGQLSGQRRSRSRTRDRRRRNRNNQARRRNRRLHRRVHRPNAVAVKANRPSRINHKA